MPTSPEKLKKIFLKVDGLDNGNVNIKKRNNYTFSPKKSKINLDRKKSITEKIFNSQRYKSLELKRDY